LHLLVSFYCIYFCNVVVATNDVVVDGSFAGDVAFVVVAASGCYDVVDHALQ
jgi:hypothetical protein